MTDQRDPLEIERSLLTIARRASAELEDRGTHTLHAIWSILRWSDPGSQQPWVAPILLVPLELRRKSARERYELVPTDEDPTFNPALRVKLENDFGVKLPDFDLEELSPQDLLACLRAELTGLPINWNIEPYAAVGLFSFAKEPMYRDLVEHAEVVAESPAVQSLALGVAVPALRSSLDVDVPTEEKLDAVQQPAEVFSVLDADSSQRIAIEAAIRGQSFVLFGPPGTGKSQTIANVIAEFVARGRSVLFVSEKMAALEVVADRLRTSDLGDLMLELHSAKSSRVEVARQLLASLDESIDADDRAFAPAAATLQLQRPRLNAYATALHEIREPLGRTLHDVLAHLDRLRDAPALPAPAVDGKGHGQPEFDHIVSLAARLADVWAPVTEGDEFVWRDAAATSFGPVRRQRTIDLIDAATRTVDAAEPLEVALTSEMVVPTPSCADDRTALLALGDLVTNRHSGPVEWLTSDDLNPHRATIDRWSEITAARLQSIGVVEEGFGPAWAEVDPTVARAVVESLRELDDGVGRTFDGDDALDVMSRTRDASRSIAAELTRAEPIIERLRATLGLRSRGGGLDDLRILIDVARISQDRNRPPGIWLSRTRLDEAGAFVAAHGRAYEAQQVATARLFESYEPILLDLDLDPLLDRMRRHNGRWWNLVRPSHRADRRALKGMTKIGRLRESVVADLEAASALRAERHRLSTLEREAKTILGSYAAGLDTDVAAVSRAIASARRLIDLPHDSTDWGVLAGRATFESPYDPTIDRDADEVALAITKVDSAMAILDSANSPGRSVTLRAMSPAELRGLAARLAEVLDCARANAAAFLERRTSGPTSVSALEREATARVEIDEADRRLAQTEVALRATFHDSWNGFRTDWPGLTSALDWSMAMRRAYGGGFVPSAVATSILDGRAAALPWRVYRDALADHEVAAPAAAALYAGSAAEVAQRCVNASFGDVRGWLAVRRQAIDQLDAWVRFQAARKDLVSAGWGGFADAAIERRSEAGELPPAATRAWLEAWTGSVIAADTRLATFTREEHQRSVVAFRSADQALIKIARERVLHQYEAGKPPSLTMQGGEQAIVRREAAKRRKLLPVRSLLAAIPNLLPRIKPCLMMSPLSVSHFLASTSRFDLVIFDEASQVPPEDAINCVYRGRQLIVAGDPKQLPPTDFFQLSATIESDSELETGVDDFESVLDLASGSGFVSRPLRWHYRSHDDSLIAFSNRLIYDGSLVTFPAPARTGDELGISFVYCPDGVFDRGRTAKNVIEARQVVGVVANELRRDRSNTLGVVAFSVAQQQAIEDEWERRLRLEPDLEGYAGVGRLQGMFIKNLETVQGDERDVIVFSIGYGRDDTGRILMNFGPLNREGGWRRLNVAVTRARRKVVVVSSITAGEISRGEASAGGPPRGAELLRAYLDYAERGVLPAGNAPSMSRGPADSDFERQVAAAIGALGWEIVTQVGASQYRIDVGVVSRSRPSRFVMGVECDGAMYHSAKTARDRDRLRQGVLEQLGWRIHRIWSQDWHERRGAAIERLRIELEAAEQAILAETQPAHVEPLTRGEEPQPSLVGALGDSAVASLMSSAPRQRRQRRSAELKDKDDAIDLPWTIPYPIVDLPPYSRTWLEFHDPGMVRHHMAMIGALVDGEGPVHVDYAAMRLSRHFGLQRVGSRMASVLDAAVAAANRSGRVSARGPFVWPMPRRDLILVRVPISGRPDTVRTIDHIPPEEIDLALLRLVESALAIDEASLRVATARVLGFDRTGDQIGEHIDARLSAHVLAGRLVTTSVGLTLGIELPSVAARTDKLEMGL